MIRNVLQNSNHMGVVGRRPTRIVGQLLKSMSTADLLSPKRKTVAVIGCGWSGYKIATDLNKKDYDVKVISPTNHWVFTPLLPSTAVGTLEFRAIQEPVRTIKDIDYYQAKVSHVDFETSTLHCSCGNESGNDFSVSYDSLVLAPGCETNTFGIQNLNEESGVYFLKELSHSRSICNRLIRCFERASNPETTEEEIEKLLTFMVVGGGPTSIEFASELYDFLQRDVTARYPALAGKAQVIICEAGNNILGSFHSSLVDYVEDLFRSRNKRLMTSTAVMDVQDHVAVLSDGQRIPFGLMVWSTGVRQTELIRNLSEDCVAKFEGSGRLKVDPYLRVLDPDLHPVGNGNVFALGDCAGNFQKPLPALAQVASQQGLYLAKLMNRYGLDSIAQLPAPVQLSDALAHSAAPSTSVSSSPAVTMSASPPSPTAGSSAGAAGTGGMGVTASMASMAAMARRIHSSRRLPTAFRYTHLGSMAQVGDWKGVYDASEVGNDGLKTSGPPVKGMLAFLLWRAAYWTKQVSPQNKMLILMYWVKSALFGRDISKF